MKRLFLVFSAILCAASILAAPRNYQVTSPDGTVKAEVSVGDNITYGVWKNSDQILLPSEISMTLDDGSRYDASVKLQKVERKAVNNVLDAPFYKKSKVKEA
jgi:alpha-glucosidase